MPNRYLWHLHIILYDLPKTLYDPIDLVVETGFSALSPEFKAS
jgi:hypothetical protein